MKRAFKLYFASEIICWYDYTMKAMYILQDGGYRRYGEVLPSRWNQLLGNPTDKMLLEIISTLLVQPTYGHKPSAEALKNRVEIQRTDGIDMYTVNSSTIKAVGYDAENRKLYVQYLASGKSAEEPIYEFDNVDIVEWNAIQAAESKGSEIWWQISLNHGKGTYRVVTGSNLNYVGLMTNPGTPHEDGYIVIR